MTISHIAQALTALAEKAKATQYSLDDLRGGSFTISNLGAIGGTYSTPIINYPEVAILLVGRSRKLPVVVEDRIEPRLMMPLSLSYDHRLVDGAAAARFLNEVIGYLQSPGRLPCAREGREAAGCYSRKWDIHWQLVSCLAAKGDSMGDIACGKQHLGLDEFAASVNAAAMKQRPELGLYDPDAVSGWGEAFRQVVKNTLAAGGKIHFNLDGVDIRDALRGDPNIFVGRYTEYELQQITLTPSGFETLGSIWPAHCLPRTS